MGKDLVNGQVRYWTAKILSSKCSRTLGITADDVHQEMRMKIHEAAEAHDENKPASQTTFTITCIRYKALRMLESGNAIKRDMILYQGLVNSYEVDESTPETRLIAAEEFIELTGRKSFSL